MHLHAGVAPDGGGEAALALADAVGGEALGDLLEDEDGFPAGEPLAEAARRAMVEVRPTGIVPGALLLFRMRAGAVAKHCGIATAPDRFIHAYERSGVVEVPLDAAWRRRIALAFLFPER